MTPEGRVKEMIKRWCKKRGYWYFIPVSGGYGKHGIPDFIICAEGRFIGVEAKAPGGEPTARQQFVLNEINEAGGIAGVVATADDLGQLDGAIEEANTI